MKIAIQGHPTRGKEVIQILESLGGKNTEKLEGTYTTFYYIDDKNEISDDHKENFSSTYKLYTLDEFEKEFPFKVGDEVMFPVKIGWASGKVTNLIYIEDKLKYEIGVRETGYHYVEPYKLSLYPIKKERNITLTLDKAKEWYNKGGELKEIALQAFTEKELNSLPRSWEEYIIRYGSCCFSTRYANMPLKYNSLLKLEQLRNCWRQGWEPEWNNCTKYVIKWEGDNLVVFTAKRVHAFLVFPSREMAEEFLECFKDLIEQAEDLI